MLSVHTAKATFCDGMTRREMLRVGGLSTLFAWAQPGMMPWSTADSLQAAVSAPNRFGQSKSVILVTL